ncbi:MAG: signal peptidase I [Clostridia bacterium]|nr:signal peptidase I [Clostridia bacterium]
MKQKDLNKKTKLVRTIIYALIIVAIYNILIVSITSILNKTGKSMFGYRAYIITTDSMKPNISQGDIIIIKETEEEKLKIDDIITFRKNNKLITHRIIEIETDEDGNKQYVTKGDNNNIEDLEKVSYQEIEGKKIVKIPVLGKVVMLLQDEVYIILIAIIILLIYLHTQKTEEKEIIRREKKKEEDEKFKKGNM